MKPVEFVCERCGKKFIKPFWFIKKRRRFCSAECKKQNPLTALLEHAKIQFNGCWNFTGTIGSGGYGQIKACGVRDSAHVMMWKTWNEQDVPEGHVVRHTCEGNPRCINPDHLITGTPFQNVHDCIDQGRFMKQKKCEENHRAKLTNESVREIRRLRLPTDGSKPPSYYKLAKRYGVSYTTVYFAANKIQWKDLD